MAPTDPNPTKIAGLDFEEAEDGYMIFEPDKERVHYLNPTAALILELCTGANSPAQIVELVQQAYGLPDPPLEAVQSALAQMKDEGLLA